ncbi:MAG: hypothetical protein RH917_06365 [Lacipirellulaceae bacterium]
MILARLTPTNRKALRSGSRSVPLLVLATLTIALGCSESLYEPQESPQDFYFAGPSAKEQEQTEKKTQPALREVATISGERFWEFDDPHGPELRLLPPIDQPSFTSEEALELDSATGLPTPTIAQPNWQQPSEEESEFATSDAYQGRKTPPLEVPESSVRETFDSTIAVMLLPPVPMDAVQEEAPVETDAETDSWSELEEPEEESTDWSFAEESTEETSPELATPENDQRLALLPTPVVEPPQTYQPEQETKAQASQDAQPTSDAEAPPAIATGTLTGAKVNEQAIAKIRRGYQLAGRGAYYAARAEFVAVLRMISQAKDSKHGKPRRTLALAAGLRALEEAADFAPQGAELDAEVPVAVIASSHRTPINIDFDNELLLPQQVMDRYFRYAQFKLGGAVAGEPAGSMALHALGKLHSQLGKLEPEQHPQAQRQAYAFQQASLMAHSNNHLAAHELGVLMAEAGHYQEAGDLLNQVVQRQPHPTVLRNLARVQKELGQQQVAVAMRQRAREMERQSGVVNGVAWVTPDAFSALGRRPTNMPVSQQSAQQVARHPGAVRLPGTPVTTQPTTAPQRRLY